MNSTTENVFLDFNKTHIVLIADISGSMASMGNIPQTKLNEFIQEQTGNVTVDFWVFNDNYKKIFDNMTPRDVNIKSEDLAPCGGTALYSSLGNIIDNVGQKIANMTDVKPGRIMVVVYTDGDENSSKNEYCGESGRLLVKSKIEHQQSIYNWMFLFLGSNIDAVNTGTSIGIARQTCINYNSSEGGYNQVFKSCSQAVDRFRNTDPSADREEVLKKVAFTDVERVTSMCADITIDPPNKRMRTSSSIAPPAMISQQPYCYYY